MWYIYRYGLLSEIKLQLRNNQKWYPYQKKWYSYHFANIPKEIHTLSPAPRTDAGEARSRRMGASAAGRWAMSSCPYPKEAILWSKCTRPIFPHDRGAASSMCTLDLRYFHQLIFMRSHLVRWCCGQPWCAQSVTVTPHHVELRKGLGYMHRGHQVEPHLVRQLVTHLRSY